MAEAHEAWIRFSEGEEEIVLVTPLGEDRYRLEVQPLLGLDECIEVFYGDVIHATSDPDGALRLRAIHTRSSMQRYTGSVPRDVAESPELDALMNRITDVGGHAERVMGGCVFAYVPEEATIDLHAEIDRVVTLVQTRKARLSSRLRAVVGRSRQGTEGGAGSAGDAPLIQIDSTKFRDDP